MSLVKPSTPRIYHRDGMPVFWALMDAPRRTFPGDAGDVADLCGNVPAGVRSTGCTYALGPFGRALSLNGTTGTVPLPSLTVRAPMTVSLWAICTNISATFPMAFSGATLYELRLAGTLGIPQFIIGTDSASASSALIQGALYHLVGVHTGSQLQIWVNGRLAGTVATSDVASATGPYIGSRATSLLWPGLIDNVQIYNYAIPPTQVAREYADPFWRLRPPPRRSWLVGPVDPGSDELASGGYFAGYNWVPPVYGGAEKVTSGGYFNTLGWVPPIYE